MIRTIVSSILLLFTFSHLLAAEESVLVGKIGAPFRDNAVLQQGMKVPVWGWSKPGTKVTVEFAGQKQSGKAGKDGKWMIPLNPLKASFEPAEMKITEAKGDSVVLKNILVGEVWLASGQSNMQWKVNKSSCLKIAQEFAEETQGKVAPIRELEVTSVVAMLHPIEKAEGVWKDGDYTEYSAIAFAFAHKLYKELNVPIGILNCSFSQTAIQAWIPREGFRDAKDEYTQAIYQQILHTDPTTKEHAAVWNEFYQSIEDTLKENKERVAKGLPPKPVPTKTPGNLSGNRDASWLYNGRLHPVVPFAICGAIWNQGYANMGEGLPYYNNLHSLVRGWRMVWGKPDLPVYFHQFYSNGMKPDTPNHPSIGSTAEMRLGTWLARDIPNTGMASQIDITGGIHYGNKAVPGQRFALHALKNQYGRKDLVTDGPMFKSYTVKDNKVIVEFDHAEGGLLVADSSYNRNSKNEDATGLADPIEIPNGEDQVTLFYVADSNRVWYPAKVKIEGSKVVLHSPKVKAPRGVTYGTGGVGFQPNIYNKALLPLTPFIYYDHKLVTSRDWQDEKLKVDGVEINPDTVGKLAEWLRMPLLSTQFRENAVFQAGVPITIWGSVMHDWGHTEYQNGVIQFSFAGVEKTIPVTDDSPYIYEIAPGESRYPGAAKEWKVTLPPMKASAEPKTLRVSFWIDGELAHERVCNNIVIGDVWYVAAPPTKFQVPAKTDSAGIVRMMTRKAKRFSIDKPSRYTVCVSRTPLNRFASEWTEATGLAATIGQQISAKTGNPVGIIFMESDMTSMGKGVPSENQTTLKSWIPVSDLKNAPSLMADYRDLAAVRPGNVYYDENARAFIDAWKQYWNSYIPQMISTKAVPDGVAWGSYPTLASSVSSQASEVYNCMVHSFTPAQLKGIIFLTSEAMVVENEGAYFGEQMAALVNSWKKRFGGDPQFIYTVPNRSLAAKASVPKCIKGQSTAITIGDWSDVSGVLDALSK